jgi:hypothetical protein
LRLDKGFILGAVYAISLVLVARVVFVFINHLASVIGGRKLYNNGRWGVKHVYQEQTNCK